MMCVNKWSENEFNQVTLLEHLPPLRQTCAAAVAVGLAELDVVLNRVRLHHRHRLHLVLVPVLALHRHPDNVRRVLLPI